VSPGLVNPADLAMVSAMIFLAKLERRFGWLSFPGFLRYFAILHVMVFVLQAFRPEVFELLEFDRDKILGGEIWRLVTCFFSISQFGGLSPMNIVFLYFGVMFSFMISDGLESVWGVFKTSLFYYTGALLILAVMFVLPLPLLPLAMFTSAFLAFATVLPKVEILLFFVLPVQVRWLGFLTGAGIVGSAFRIPELIPFLVPCYLFVYANYLIWAGIPALMRIGRHAKAARRRSQFKSVASAGGNSFHQCAHCNRTENSDPSLEFRVGPDGNEYCEEHLPK
jgi:hypothetical protein